MAHQSPPFKALKVWIDEDLVGHLELNRPHAANSINADMWSEVPKVGILSFSETITYALPVAQLTVIEMLHT